MIIKECCNHSNTARKANNMNEIINNWDLILNTFKNECDIQNLSFTTFIKPLQVISVSDNEITLLSDTQMSANYVEKRYLKFLEVTISEIMKKDYKLRIISEDTLNEETAKKTAQNAFLSAKTQPGEDYRPAKIGSPRPDTLSSPTLQLYIMK